MPAFRMAFPQFLRIATLAKFNASDTSEPVTDLDLINSMEVKLVEILASKLRFSYEPVSPADGELGRQLDNGSWSGMVGMVGRGEADLIVYMLGVTYNRSLAVDFSTPYSITRFTFATAKPQRTLNMASILQPFSSEVWCCVLFYALVKILTAFFLRKVQFGRRNGKADWDVQKPRNAGEYLLASSYAFADTFLSYFYVSVLLAFLTFPTLTRVGTVSELAKAVRLGTHQCATTRNSFIVQLFKTSKDSNRKTIGHSLGKWNGSSDAEEALMSSNSTLKVAFFTVENHFLSLSREYIVSQDTLFNHLRGVGLKKGFCCKARLDSFINYLSASGIYDKIMNDVLFKISLRSSKRHSSEESSQRSLSLGDLQVVFIVLVTGHILALLVFVFEIAVFKYNKKQC